MSLENSHITWSQVLERCPNFALVYRAAEELVRAYANFPSQDHQNYTVEQRCADFSDFFVSRFSNQDDQQMGVEASIARAAVDELAALPLDIRNEALEAFMYFTQGMREAPQTQGPLEKQIEQIEGFVAATRSIGEKIGEQAAEWRLPRLSKRQ